MNTPTTQGKRSKDSPSRKTLHVTSSIKAHQNSASDDATNLFEPRKENWYLRHKKDKKIDETKAQ